MWHYLLCVSLLLIGFAVGFFAGKSWPKRAGQIKGCKLIKKYENKNIHWIN